MYGVSLAKDIDDEWGLDINTIKEHVCKKLALQAKKLGLTGIYFGDYQKINDLTKLEEWIIKASQKIAHHMDNAKEVYYATNATFSVVIALNKLTVFSFVEAPQICPRILAAKSFAPFRIVAVSKFFLVLWVAPRLVAASASVIFL